MRYGLPVAVAISTLTLAELSAGPAATSNPPSEHGVRIGCSTEATFDSLPFGGTGGQNASILLWQ